MLYPVTINLGPSSKRRKTDAELNSIGGKNKILKMTTKNGCKMRNLRLEGVAHCMMMNVKNPITSTKTRKLSILASTILMTKILVVLVKVNLRGNLRQLQSVVREKRLKL